MNQVGGMRVAALSASDYEQFQHRGRALAAD
jgi:hypothetical protein